MEQDLCVCACVCVRGVEHPDFQQEGAGDTSQWVEIKAGSETMGTQKKKKKGGMIQLPFCCCAAGGSTMKFGCCGVWKSSWHRSEAALGA